MFLQVLVDFLKEKDQGADLIIKVLALKRGCQISLKPFLWQPSLGQKPSVDRCLVLP
ncbi:hypothetical protein KJ761_00575 [Patescibacteria group bacterium]|nr:hypothetical protein [Patescibacteria group bacterium]